MTVLHSRDHGGDGPLLLLLHGAGRSSADWAAAAPRLTGRHRVLAVDLPGHGRSAPAGSWDFAEVCADLDDTLTAAGSAGRVAVAGHSLGGMVASAYAATRPDRVAAAVDLDGFGWGRPDQYPGVPEEEAARRPAEIGAMSRAAAGARMPAGYVADQVAYSVGLGIPRVPAEETCRASVRELPGGEWQLLPERPGAVEMLDAMDGLDLFAVLRRVLSAAAGPGPGPAADAARPGVDGRSPGRVRAGPGPGSGRAGGPGAPGRGRGRRGHPRDAPPGPGAGGFAGR
ncbi:alpha/beta fold hydrolase [Streptomyces anulatus]|uniref:alpha/beta fold hydrolase n=1 Tax=Streptomyces anulatus TaxID=1892 RepID=UPI00403E07AD